MSLITFDGIQAEQELIDEYCTHFDASWIGWTISGTSDPIPRENDWRSTIERFLRAGVPVSTMIARIPIAMNSQAMIDNKWRYFCGIIWKTIDEATERALQSVENDDE